MDVFGLKRNVCGHLWIGRIRYINDGRPIRRIHMADISVIAVDRHLATPRNIEFGNMLEIIDLHALLSSLRPSLGA